MGATCDETCEALGLSNVALEAAKVIQNKDCTLVQRFTNFAGRPLYSDDTSRFYWSFGFIESDRSYISCAYFCDRNDSDECWDKKAGDSYKSFKVGAEPGSKNGEEKRRLICPCS